MEMGHGKGRFKSREYRKKPLSPFAKFHNGSSRMDLSEI